MEVPKFELILLAHPQELTGVLRSYGVALWGSVRKRDLGLISNVDPAFDDAGSTVNRPDPPLIIINQLIERIDFIIRCTKV